MSRHTIIPAVHLFLIKDDQILLARRFQTGYEDGNYSVPAGHVEKAESATAAMIRESREEIGVSIRLADLRPIHVMHRSKDGEERVDFFFECKKWTGDVLNQEPEKCDDLRWFPMNELPENIVPYISSAVEYYERSISYSEYGWHGEQ